MITFNGKEIPQNIIEETKQYFINLNKECIKGAENGEFHVNDLESYIKQCLEYIENMEKKTDNFSFTFLQQAYFLMTGESVALLP